MLCCFCGVLTWFLILGCRRMWLWWLMKCTMIQIQHTPVALDELKGSIGELHWRPFNWVSGQLLHFQISPLEHLNVCKVTFLVASSKNRLSCSGSVFWSHQSSDVYRGGWMLTSPGPKFAALTIRLSETYLSIRKLPTMI